MELPVNQMAVSAPLLEVKGVTLQYKTREHLVTATYRVSFDVHRSDRFVLLGPSGCGKSTLLKAVGGYMAPTEGTLKLKGQVIRKPGADRCMVFQEFDQLLPWKTVKKNVMFGLESSGTLRGKAAEERAMQYIDKVNLTKFADAYPHTLSGGMKQRVAIARAMAMEPDILLMDEPFAALDALTRRKMQDELLQLWDDTKFTVLFVTHSIPEAVLVGNRILMLSPHPGQVKAELNSDGSDPVGADGKKLSDTIHDMLFAEQVEETGAPGQIPRPVARTAGHAAVAGAAASLIEPPVAGGPQT
jgi:NitT/TauT family transport system ATP-binding protein